MSLFNAVHAAAARGEHVATAMLVEADFKSAPYRAWTGAGPLVTADGREWSGLGEVLSIGDLAQVQSGQSAATTITLEGVSAEVIKAALESEAEAKGRLIRFYMQFFGDSLQTLGNPVAIATLQMDVPRYQMGGPDSRRVSISCENLLAKRRRVPHGRLTDADQQARYPGDKGLEYASALTNKVVTWPDF